MIKDNSISSRVLDCMIHLILVTVFILTLFPILHIASVSLSSGSAISKNIVSIFPVEPNLATYEMVLFDSSVPASFKNSVIYTLLGTAINILLTTTMAYALSKRKLPFRGFFTALVLLTMFVSGGIIPEFLLIKSLHMYDTLWAMVLPGGISAFNLIIMRTFFASLPDELEESAFLDGANDVVVFARIAMPLSKAAVATISLFYLVHHWNSFMPAIMFLKSSSKYPLQVILREIVIAGKIAQEMAMRGDTSYMEQIQASSGNISVDSIKYATLVVSILPMLMVYPFIQRYFVKGVMIGSVKG